MGQHETRIVAKAFSVASWNVRHFGAGDTTNAEAAAFLAEQEPDVVGIYEVTGKEVWQELMEAMPGYSFFITEGRNTQEILLGIGPGVTAFLTQKIEFQAENAFMRPGPCSRSRWRTTTTPCSSSTSRA